MEAFDNVSLPGLTLLQTDTEAAVPSPPEYTLPEPSSVPEVRDDDDGGASDRPEAAAHQSESAGGAGTLEGPERQAQTLGEYKMCSMCNVYLNSKGQADMHYGGKLHQKKLRQKAFTDSLAATTSDVIMHVSQSENTARSPPAADNPPIYLPYCAVCGLTFTGAEQVQMHLMGARHAKKLRQTAQKETVEKVKEEPAKTSSVSESFYCKHCNVICTSQTQLDQHFQGSKHKNVTDASKQATGNRPANQPAASEAAAPASTVYTCPTCNITANSEQQYIQHCSSARHNNKLLNRPGKDKYRDHPYPNRRGAQGVANKPQINNANRPVRGGGKWKSSNNSFNQRTTFNSNNGGCSNNSSPRPGRGRGQGRGRGRGRGWVMQSNNNPDTSYGNSSTSGYSAARGSFGGGYDRIAAGPTWGASNASPGGRRWQGGSMLSPQEQTQWVRGSTYTQLDSSYAVPDLDSFEGESYKEQTNYW